MQAIIEPSGNPSPSRAGSIWKQFVHSVPPAIIFGILGALLFWGHRTGWTIPRFSELRGEAGPVKADWCPLHSVPESECVECNPGLMPRAESIGYCKIHGVHDCTLCNPGLAQTQTSRAVSPDDLDRADSALAFAERPTNNSRCKQYRRLIQFESEKAVEKYGIGVEAVWTAPVVEAVPGTAEITYDQTLTARLSARAPGSVFRAFKQVGDTVKRGELVALVDAGEVGRAKAVFLQSIVQSRLETQNYERVKKLAGNGASQQEVDRAFAALSEVRIGLSTAQQTLTNLGLPVEAATFEGVTNEQLPDRLRFHGLPKSVTETLDPKTTTGNLLPIVAPFDGVVAMRDVVAGEVVDTTKVMFLIVDPRQLWLVLDVRAEDAKAIQLGTPIRFRPDGGKDEVSSRVSWVSTEARHDTRTVKVRATVPNADGKLRANTFGTGRAILREEPKAIVVPNEAVHFEGCCHVVFVRDKNYLNDGAPKVFHVRTVRIGARDDKQTEIIAGVLPGELIAVQGSTVLRSELLKNNLGAGCDCCNK